jgi:DNA-binding transcriptional LysR family regulator
VKDAAQELCVTPGAVSQMIKSLEQHLGVALFLRVNRPCRPAAREPRAHPQHHRVLRVGLADPSIA